MLAIRPLAVALTTNFFFAYTLSHVFGLRYASIGLLCGGVVLCMWTSFSVLEVLRSPEYSFSKV